MLVSDQLKYVLALQAGFRWTLWLSLGPTTPFARRHDHRRSPIQAVTLSSSRDWGHATANLVRIRIQQDAHR
jgi:hypothetical protein